MSDYIFTDQFFTTWDSDNRWNGNNGSYLFFLCDRYRSTLQRLGTAGLRVTSHAWIFLSFTKLTFWLRLLCPFYSRFIAHICLLVHLFVLSWKKDTKGHNHFLDSFTFYLADLSTMFVDWCCFQVGNKLYMFPVLLRSVWTSKIQNIKHKTNPAEFNSEKLAIYYSDVASC